MSLEHFCEDFFLIFYQGKLIHQKSGKQNYIVSKLSQRTFRLKFDSPINTKLSHPVSQIAALQGNNSCQIDRNLIIYILVVSTHQIWGSGPQRQGGRFLTQCITSHICTGCPNKEVEKFEIPVCWPFGLHNTCRVFRRGKIWTSPVVGL